MVDFFTAVRLRAIFAAFITIVEITPLEIVAIKTFTEIGMAGNVAELVRV